VVDVSGSAAAPPEWGRRLPLSRGGEVNSCGPLATAAVPLDKGAGPAPAKITTGGGCRRSSTCLDPPRPGPRAGDPAG
jgi:hypothetical protein